MAGPVPTTRSMRLAALLAAAAIVLAGCTDAAEVPTTTVSTTTTFAPIEILTVSTTIAPGVDPDVYEQITGVIAELVTATENLRGLAYLQVPDVLVLAEEDHVARFARVVADQVDEERLAFEEDVYRLLGQHTGSSSIVSAMQRFYSGDDVTAFYDGRRSQVVVDGSRAELAPLQRSEIVRALAAALIDQYHDYYDRVAELEASGDLDATDALRTLAEADAIAVQLRYLQGLPEAEREAAALAAAALDRPELERLPSVIRSQLAMPAEEGVLFVDSIVASGGYAALDAAYDPPPATTEQLLHPARFAVRETVRSVPELAIDVAGFEVVEEGTYGEWRLQLLLQDAVQPGLLTQTASGWGGDAYQLLASDDDLLFVYIYGGDTKDDAIEVAQALLALARGPMQAGDGVDSGGGVLWEGSRYVFVDRIGDGLVFIVSTSGTAGNAVRSQVRVP